MKKPDLFVAGYYGTEVFLNHRFERVVEGVENLGDEPVLLAVNHLHFADSQLVAAAVYNHNRMRTRFLAKKEYFEGGGVDGKYPRTVEFFMKGTRQIPTDRSTDNPKAYVELRKAVAEARDNGDTIGIHPEGTRSPDGRLYRARAAMAHLSIDLSLPIQPVGLIYGDRLDNGKRPVLVRFGEALAVPVIGNGVTKSAATRQLTHETQRAMAELSGQEFADEFAPIGQLGVDDS